MPDFKPSDKSALLFLDAPRPASLGAYSVAFFPFGAQPSTVGIDQGWSENAGVYIFLNADRGQFDEPAFLLALRVLLNDPAWRNTRVLWIANPAAPLGQWHVDGLAGTRNGDAVDRAVFFDFRNFSLGVARGAAASVSNGVLQINQAGGFRLLVSGSPHLTDIGDTLLVPFTGDSAGCLQFRLTLGLPDASQRYEHLETLDIAFRMFLKDGDFPVDDANFFMRALRYPLFPEQDVSEYAEPLRFQVSLDPLNPLNGTRTCFVVQKPTAAGASLPSCFRTTMGRHVRLNPIDGNSRCVFAVAPTTSAQNPDDPYYLTPAGAFSLMIEAAGASQLAIADRNLLCGLSGIEFVKADSNTNIIFEPGRSAFAPGFSSSSNEAGTATADLLSNAAVTSWVYIDQTGASTPVYYAQPDDSIFFKPFNDQPGASTGDLLEAVEVPNFPLPPATDAAFPMVPYGGVEDDDLDLYRELEVGRIGPARWRAIRDIYEAFRNRQIPAGSGEARDLPLAPTAGGEFTAVTPHGLLATFAADFETWKEVVLATDKDNNQLRLRNIPRGLPIRDALLSNKLFLVISHPDQLAPFLTAGGDLLDIAGWGFDFAPERWADHGTVLVFKSFDKALDELIEQPALWTLHETFNPDLETVLPNLSRLIRDAKAKGGPDADPKDQEKYGALFSVVTDPAWAGIVAFNLRVAPDSFPDDLRALASGIDQSKFYAQYFGIDTSPVHRNGATLQADASSLFGLIDYVSDAAPFPASGGFNFAVTKLSAVFKNSELASFAAEVGVTIDMLFGEASSLIGATNGRNIVTLSGTAENHNGVPTYSFGFSGDNRFVLPASNVFEQVEILKASFSTDPSDSPEHWVASEAGLAAGGTSIAITRGQNTPRAGSNFTIEGDDQTYVVGGFSNGNLTFTPAAVKAIPGSAPLNFDSLVSARFVFSGNLIFRSWPAAVATGIRIDSAGAAVNDTQTGVTSGTLQLREGDVFSVGNLAQPYTVGATSTVSHLVFTPGAVAAFAPDAEVRRLDPAKAFDVLSFGPADASDAANRGLRFSNLLVHLSFHESAPAGRTFEFDPAKLAFDLQRTTVRPQSVYAKFPLLFTEFLHKSSGPTPASLGFLDVKTPLGGTAPSGDWYGMTYDLQLGSLGALAGKAGLVVTILTAWEPASPEKGLYVGLRLPGSGLAREFNVQGIIKIAFKTIQFIVNNDALTGPANYGYILKLKNITLKFLVLTLPPKAQTEIVIFGNPKGTPEDRTLGWFAAYQKAGGNG